MDRFHVEVKRDDTPAYAMPDVDVDGLMAGLTAAETSEFVALDARNYIDDNGNPFPWPWDVTGAAKNRWLQLYEKHEAALTRMKTLERLRCRLR
jgi:hypothetical protein